MSALVIGIFYLVTGLAGFAAAGTGSADVLGILGVNPLHNVIHIVVFGALRTPGRSISPVEPPRPPGAIVPVGGGRRGPAR